MLLYNITAIEYIVPESLLIPIEERKYQFRPKLDVFALYSQSTIFYPGMIADDTSNDSTPSNVTIQFDPDDKDSSPEISSVEKKYVFSRDHLIASHPSCPVCKRFLRDRLNVPFCKCVKCDKVYMFHPNCIDTYASASGGKYTQTDVFEDH